MYRTKIELTVLSEEPIPEGMDVDGVLREGYDGDFVLSSNWLSSERLSREEMAVALTEAGSDPSFFQIADER